MLTVIYGFCYKFKCMCICKNKSTNNAKIHTRYFMNIYTTEFVGIKI